MRQFAMEATMPGNDRRIAYSHRPVISGVILAAGSVVLFVGTLFYARLTTRLGLPALSAERTQALGDALAIGPQKLFLAGGLAFLGDCLLLAACIALARGRSRPGDLSAVGWSLIAVSAATAMIFDSMTAVLFWPLAHGADATPFLAFKAWFDFLFAAANVLFGLGCVAVLWVDVRSEARLLSKGFNYFGIAVGAAAAVSGFGYISGLLHLPLVVGLTVTVGCIVLAALGVQIARKDGVALAVDEVSGIVPLGEL
jgi:hypothetical protein